MMRISKNEYYLLSESEKSGYEYFSNAEGCYFEKPDIENEENETVDDFERLTKKEEGI